MFKDQYLYTVGEFDPLTIEFTNNGTIKIELHVGEDRRLEGDVNNAFLSSIWKI